MPKLTFRLLLLNVVTSLCFNGMLANASSSNRNVIYIFDCTRSMNGFDGAPNIWTETKGYLKEQLNKECSNGSTITILPFQDRVLSPIRVNSGALNWHEIESSLDHYIENITATNICDAWVAAESLVDRSKENYIFLFTDGRDNIGGHANETARSAKLAQLISNFCGKYNNTKGIYLRLTENATLPLNVQSAIAACSSVDIVDASNGIPEMGSPVSQEIRLNTRDLPADIEVGFSNVGNFKAYVANNNNDLLNISLNEEKITNGRFTIHIDSKFGDNPDRLNATLNNLETPVEFSIESKDVLITNPELTLFLNPTPLRTLSFMDSASMEASITRTKPFLWTTANDYDTLVWELQPLFNSQAQKEDAKVFLRLKSETPLEGCSIIIGNQSIDKDSTFVIDQNSDGIIKIVFPRSFDDHSGLISLFPVHSIDLDRINEKRFDQFEGIQLPYSVSTSWSPLEIIVWVFVAILLIVIVVWFGFLRDRVYPKFKSGIVNITSPYFSSIRVKGSRMLVITPKAQKQTFIDKALIGRFTYHINNNWPCECQVTPSGRNMRFAGGEQLISDPMPTWQRGMEYRIIDTQDNKSIAEITIN